MKCVKLGGWKCALWGGGKVSFFGGGGCGVRMCQILGVEMCWDEVNYYRVSEPQLGEGTQQSPPPFHS